MPGREGVGALPPLLGGRYRDPAALAAGAELDGSGTRREDRVVAPDAGSRPRLEARAALAHDDLAAGHGLTCEHLHAQPFSLGVAAVAARPQSLFVRHL